MTTLNGQGIVLDVPFSNQLEAGESQDLCGNFGVALLAYAGLPGKGPRGTTEDVDQLADWIASKWNAGPVNELGSTVQNMYDYFTVTDKNGVRYMHYQQIDPNIDSIKIAINAGYPVLVTVNEQNVRSVKTGQRPVYSWNFNANHIIPLMGISHDGNFISPDYLNNRYQGEWPCVYDASVLAPSWAAVVQVLGPEGDKNPWLDHIPGNDPRSWPKGFNAQLFAKAAAPVIDTWKQQALDVWNSSPAKVFSPSGIQNAWLDQYKTNNLGVPVTPEISTVDWQGNPRKYQCFSSGDHAEYDPKANKVYLLDRHNKMYKEY